MFNLNAIVLIVKGLKNLNYSKFSTVVHTECFQPLLYSPSLAFIPHS